MLSFLLHRLRPYPGAMLLIFTGLLLEVGFHGLIPLTLRYLIDQVMVARNPLAIFGLLLFLGLGAVVASAAAFVRDRTWVQTQAHFLEGLRQEMFDHLQRLSIGFFAYPGNSGDVFSRFSRDLTTIEEASSMAIAWGLLPGFECVFTTALMFALNMKLSLVAVLVWLWAIFTPRILAARAERANDDRHHCEAALLTELQENFTVQLVVKVFGLERLRTLSFAARNRAWRKSATAAGILNSMLERLTTSGILLIQVGVLGLGAWMCFLHQITVGTLVSFQALLLLLSDDLIYEMQYLPSLIRAKGGLSRIRDLLAIQPEVRDGAGTVEAPPLSREIEIRDITFSYFGDRTDLDHVSLVIPRGSFVAFVGGSGSGKTTLLNLVMRFYDGNSGHVLVDGRDLRAVRLRSWRRQIGVVFQESVLFDVSLRENIRIAKPGATNEEIIAAARAAEIHDFITALPQGYDTRAGARGGHLSGGQRQRIAIARAILRDPAILILDEATSALDPGTEFAINAALAHLGRGRTTISVTHRLSSVATADLIFVLDRGRLVEYGTHLELLSHGGAYAALWRKQNGFQIAADGSHVAIAPDRLAQIPILSGLAKEELVELAPLFRSQTYRPGDIVVLEGDNSGSFYIVVRGRVEVLKGSKRLAVLEDGDHFGEIALLTGSPRTATVQATVNTCCISLEKGDFDALLTRAPRIREQVERVAKGRMEGQLDSSAPVSG